MLNNSLLWQLAYHLCGLKLLGRTSQEPLGTLPVSVKTAVLEIAHEVHPDEIELRSVERQLLKAEDPKRATYRWLESWCFVHNDVKDIILQEAIPGEHPHYKSLNDFIHKYNLEKPKDSSLDEHYAERLFLEEAFLPVFGIPGLSFLQAQLQFKDASKRRRWIDFVLYGAKKYAIEIEGSTYHDSAIIPRAKFTDETQRRRSLSESGFVYKPIAFEEIKSGEARRYLTEMALADPVLRLRLIDPEPQQSRPTLYYLYALLARFPEQFPKYQKVALRILWEATNQKRKRIVIADWSPTLALLPVALLDTVALVEQVARLYGLEVDLPQLDICIVGTYDQIGVYEVLKRYLGTEPGEGDRRVDASRTQVNIHFVEALPEADYVFACETTVPPPMKDCLWDDESLKRFSVPFERMVDDHPPDALPKVTAYEVLDYFARRYFPVPELKERQHELLVKILNQESVLGILPTGYGKSLVFQLYAILVPRTTFVISPLRSLIQDQIQNLSRQGMVYASSITSQDNPSSRAEKYKNLQAHRCRLFYISPERLTLKEFYTEIQSTLKNSPVGALVVDEAHCVSEWGHDFRPAYLQIDRFRKTIESATGHEVPIIALTATASPDVREDILNVLGLNENAIVQLESSDRPNLSLSVWSVDPHSGAKSEMLKRLITQEIPKALNIPFEELVPIEGKPPYDHAGVVFGIYAAPTGSNTTAEGVHFIAQELVNGITKDDKQVKVYASKPPRLCPRCHSALLVKASDDDLVHKSIISKKGLWPPEKEYLKCQKCDHVFPRREAQKDANWEKNILQWQDGFHKSQFPLLVATKGFGMGIDKRNIRFIVHHAFASGLEGYYQEAGRSGRDDEHAHVALMYIPPHPECENEYLKDKSPPKPPCVSDRWWKCAYGLPVLCDYGRQARFIEGSYEGIEKDLESIMKIYRSLEKERRSIREASMKAMRMKMRMKSGTKLQSWPCTGCSSWD